MVCAAPWVAHPKLILIDALRSSSLGLFILGLLWAEQGHMQAQIQICGAIWWFPLISRNAGSEFSPPEDSWDFG